VPPSTSVGEGVGHEIVCPNLYFPTV
jgi:hypothetical protein